MLQDKPLHTLFSFVPLTQGIRTEATSQGLSSPTPLQAAVCLHHSAVVFVPHLYLSTHFSERVLAGSQDPGLSRTLCLIPTLCPTRANLSANMHAVSNQKSRIPG